MNQHQGELHNHQRNRQEGAVYIQIAEIEFFFSSKRVLSKAIFPRENVKIKIKISRY
jgi:hypothetical protein